MFTCCVLSPIFCVLVSLPLLQFFPVATQCSHQATKVLRTRACGSSGFDEVAILACRFPKSSCCSLHISREI
jgi:hypothetical protein